MVNPESDSFREITVLGEDKPGLLAKICATLGAAKINIDTIASERSPEGAMIKLGVDKEDAAILVLRKAGFNVRESSVILVKLLNRPGELAKLTKKLADAGVNITSIYVVQTLKEHTIDALSADDMDKAREIISADY